MSGSSRTPVLLGITAVVLFSATATATRAASHGFGGVFAGCGRVLLGGLLASAMLAAIRPGWPTTRQWRALVPVMIGCGLGFPILLSLALACSDASHASVVLGLIPLATLIVAGERLSARAVVATCVGTAAVVGEAWLASGGAWTMTDGLLGGAVVMAALGYVAGGRLAREMPGWQVICWGVAVPLPLTIAWSAMVVLTEPGLGERIASAPPSAWAGLLWVGLVSQVLGFLPWYAALARGGIARIGRLQLLQPDLSVLLAWALMGEHPRGSTLAALAIVLACLAFSRSGTTSTACPATPATPAIAAPVPASDQRQRLGCSA